jgi:hypothetical protein
MSSAVVTMERVVDKIRELEARIRALERVAEDNRALDDIRTSITMLAESMANNAQPDAHSQPRQAQTPPPSSMRRTATASDSNVRPNSGGLVALADPRFRII